MLFLNLRGGLFALKGARKLQKGLTRKLKLLPVLGVLPKTKVANWLSITRTAESLKKTATVMTRFLREDRD